jgi:DNA modification methylase
MQNEIIHGDGLEIMRSMPNCSIDLICTDPPYFLPATHYNVRSGSFRSLGDLSIIEHFFRDVFEQAARVLKPTGFLYSFCDGQSYPVFYATSYAFFRKLRPLVWDKLTSINGYSWRHQHELILFAECSESPAVKTGDGDVLRARAVPIKEREHLAQKPTDLLCRLISKSAAPGSVVLDPFCGSGSVCVAAKMCGCSYIGIDREEAYVAVAKRRAAEECGRFTNSTQQQQCKMPLDIVEVEL